MCMCDGTCNYVAEKSKPETWNGDDPSDWGLDRSTERGGLEVETWECPHPSIDRHDHCVFHTDPEEVPEDVDEREALLAAIEEAGESPTDEGPEHRGQFVGATFGAIDLSDETIAADSHDIRFDHAEFRGTGDDLDFTNTTFVARDTKPVSFRGASFTTEGEGDVSFSEASFTTEGEGDVLFSGASFTTEGEGRVSFYKASFTTDGEGAVVFSGASFTTDGEGHVWFGGASFTTDGEGHVWFGGASFTTEGEGDVWFEGASFTTEGEGDVWFSEASFTTEGEGHVWFSEASFTTEGEGRVSFYKASFTTEGEGDVWFSGASFTTEGEGDVLFSEASFTTEGEGDIRFTTTTFVSANGAIKLARTQFGGFSLSSPATATRRRFPEPTLKIETGDVRFDDATFSSADECEFRSCRFTDDTSFDDATFECPVSFEDVFIDTLATLSVANAEFYGECLFGSSDGRAEFRGGLDFSRTTFDKHVDFTGDSTTDSGPPTARRAGSSDKQDGAFSTVFSGHVSFRKATLPDGTDFTDTKFPVGADFSGANLSGVNFSRSDLSGANVERARLNRAELLGTNLVGAKLYGALLGDARINHETQFWPVYPDAVSIRNILLPGESPVPNHISGLWVTPPISRRYTHWKTWLRQGSVPYCRYDPRYATIDDDLPGIDDSTSDEDGDKGMQLEKAAEVYGTIETLARDNSLQRLASEAFIGRKDVQRRQYWREDAHGRQRLMWIRSFVPNLVARYGESPWRVLGFGGGVIAVCGFLYWAFDLIAAQGSDGEPATLLESLYFSALTFTTLGYGDFRPTNSVGQFLAVSETAIGVTMLAILVFVFGRRATR